MPDKGLMNYFFLGIRFRHFWARNRAWRRYNKDAVRGHPAQRRLFKSRHKYDLNLLRPLTHSERTYARKLLDHNPIFAELTDKHRVRIYVDKVLGKGTANRLMVPVLARAISFDDLPTELWQTDVIIKCTHGSGMNCVVPAGDPLARNRARRKVNRWLAKVHGAHKSEWCYFDLTPSLIVEPLLPAVSDIKLYFYDGVLRFIMPENNLGAIPSVGIYTPTWQRLPYGFRNFETELFTEPVCLDQILKIAGPLAAGFDMIRIDFLLTGDQFYLGELTLYDGSGLVAFSNYDDDLAFARYWRQRHLGFDQDE